MLRSAEVFLRVWAVCLATVFVFIAKRELMSSSNVAVVASPIHSAERRTRSLGKSATAQLVDTLLEKVANLENEVNYSIWVFDHTLSYFILYLARWPM